MAINGSARHRYSLILIVLASCTQLPKGIGKTQYVEYKRFQNHEAQASESERSNVASKGQTSALRAKLRHLQKRAEKSAKTYLEIIEASSLIGKSQFEIGNYIYLMKKSIEIDDTRINNYENVLSKILPMHSVHVNIPIIEGKVHYIDRNNIEVHIDVGTNHGVCVGYALYLYDGKFIKGIIIVEKVDEKTSVCRRIRVLSNDRIQVGDIVSSGIIDYEGFNKSSGGNDMISKRKIENNENARIDEWRSEVAKIKKLETNINHTEAGIENIKQNYINMINRHAIGNLEINCYKTMLALLGLRKQYQYYLLDLLKINIIYRWGSGAAFKTDDRKKIYNGVITSINNDDSEITISSGRKHGVRLADSIYVYRNSKLIGILIVIYIENKYSICLICRDITKTDLRVGDIASSKTIH